MTTLATVTVCDCCDGSGEVQAATVPAVDCPPVQIVCPLCGGLGVRMVAA